MKLKALLLATALISGAPAIASAQEATTIVNFGIANNYIFRGADQNPFDGSLNGMQVFGGADVSYGNFYVGTWASNVDYGKAQFEIDTYVGFKPKLGPVTLDLGVLAYFYPQDQDNNIIEVKAAASVANEAGMSLTGSLFYSPEGSEFTDGYLYGEISGSAAIPGAKLGPFAFSVNGAIGSQAFDNGLGDYNNWKVGVTAATESGWAIDVFYTDTDLDAFGYDQATTVQLKRTF